MNTANKIKIYTIAAMFLIGGLVQSLEIMAEDTFSEADQKEAFFEPGDKDPDLTSGGAVTSDQVVKYSDDPVRASFERAGLLDPISENMYRTKATATASGH